jgi:hypothetical protein
MSLTHAQFAAHLVRIASVAATWGADTLHPFQHADEVNEPVSHDAIERFLTETRGLLTELEGAA